MVDNNQSLLNTAKIGCIKTLSDCIEAGARVNYISDSSGRAALHYAALNNQHDAIKFLTDNGADVEVSDFFRLTPLSLTLSNLEKSGKDRDNKIKVAIQLIKLGATYKEYSDNYPNTAELIRRTMSSIDLKEKLNRYNDHKDNSPGL